MLTGCYLHRQEKMVAMWWRLVLARTEMNQDYWGSISFRAFSLSFLEDNKSQYAHKLSEVQGLSSDSSKAEMDQNYTLHAVFVSTYSIPSVDSCECRK